MKRLPYRMLVLATAIFLTANACYYDNEETLYGSTPNCAATSYTYSVEVGPLIAKYCATSGCHDSSNAGNVTLQSYAQVVEHSTRVNQRTVIDKTMPPDGGLTADQINTIRCWIANGTPK